MPDTPTDRATFARLAALPGLQRVELRATWIGAGDVVTCRVEVIGYVERVRGEGGAIPFAGSGDDAGAALREAMRALPARLRRAMDTPHA